jgi:hypothetical protein
VSDRAALEREIRWDQERFEREMEIVRTSRAWDAIAAILRESPRDNDAMDYLDALDGVTPGGQQ